MPFEQPHMRFMYISFTQEVRTRVTSSQHRWSDLDQWYFELKASREPQGIGRSGLCCKVAERIFQKDQGEIYWNTAFLTEGKPDFFSHVVVKRSGKLLQTPSSHHVGTFGVSVCLVDWWKAS